MKSMTVRFTSKCHGCGKPIQKGSTIWYDQYKRKAYHEHCDPGTKKAKLIGEKTAGMTAVEIYDGERLVWSRRYFDDGCTDTGYMIGLLQVVEDMLNCADVSDYENGACDDGSPILMDDSETAGVICEYDSDTKAWIPGDYTLGQSVEIAAALMITHHLPADDDVLAEYENDNVVSWLTQRIAEGL